MIKGKKDPALAKNEFDKFAKNVLLKKQRKKLYVIPCNKADLDQLKRSLS